MIKILERLKRILLINIWSTYDQIDLRPVKSERKSVVSRRPGRAIAPAVSRRLPTAAARVQTRIWSCEIL
jgi:hypothetical protein